MSVIELKDTAEYQAILAAKIASELAENNAETAETSAEAAAIAAASSAGAAANYTSGMFKGRALTSTVPVVVAGMPQWWLGSGAGTYTNFGGLVATMTFVILSYSGTAWSKFEAAITLNILSEDLNANGKAINNLPEAILPTQPMRKQEVDNHLAMGASKYFSTLNYVDVSTIIQGSYRNSTGLLNTSAGHAYDTTLYLVIPDNIFVAEGIQQGQPTSVAMITFYDINKVRIRSISTIATTPYEFTPLTGEYYVTFSFSITNMPAYKFYPKTDILSKETFEIEKVWGILQLQIKAYNSAYNLKGICKANQVAPVGVLNDVYYYNGSSTATVFGIINVVKNSLLRYNGAGWEILIIDISGQINLSSLFMIPEFNYINSTTIIQGSYRNLNGLLNASAGHFYDTTLYSVIPDNIFVAEGIQQGQPTAVAMITFYDINKVRTRSISTVATTPYEFTPLTGEYYVSFSSSISNISNYKFHPKTKIYWRDINKNDQIQADLFSLNNAINWVSDKNLVLKPNLNPINAVNGIIVDSEDGITKAGLPTENIGTVKAVYDEESFKAFNVENILKITSQSNEAAWKNYLAIKITKDDLINAGADFVADNVYVSAKFLTKQPATLCMGWPIVIRYGSALSYTLNLDTSASGSDVRIESTGIPGGFGDGDLTTWNGVVITKQTLGIFSSFKIENVRVPAVYKGKNFTGMILIASSSLQSFTSIVDQYFINPALVVGTSINSFKNYNNSIEVSTDPTIEDLVVLIEDKETRISTLENTVNDGVLIPFDEYYAACGDSITNANHNGIEDILLNDLYLPFDGYAQVSTYKRKCYAYFIARKNRLKWANYGWGGTTLIDCTINGISKNGFSIANGRYTQLKAGINFKYISLFFGWNDNAYGPIQQREIWLQETYGSVIYYPQLANLIGTAGFATQAQYNACNAATGIVGGITYNTASEYFRAKFIGTIGSTDVKTWFGAWNVVLPYLMLKYPIAKILIIVPYIYNATEQRDACISVANKWGLAYYDFRESCKFMEENYTPITGYAHVMDFRKATLAADFVHPNQAGYEYMFPSMDAKLMST